MVAKTVLTSGPKAGISHRGVRHVRLEKQMKKFLLVTIIGSVLAALAANGAPQPLAATAVPASAECDCSKLKDLQLELRNAMKLQQAFTGKIAELRAMNRESAAIAFANFAKSAATTVTRPATDKGPTAIDYISRGDGVSPDDDGKVKGEGLCLKSENADLALRDLDSGASCAGIAKAVRAHEDYHQNECSRLTYMVYREKHPADRAAEEAAAYGVQIAALRAEIGKVLEHTVVRIESEAHTRFTMPPSPAPLTAEVVDNRGVVPMSRVSVSGEMIKLEGQGNQTTNATLEGNCRFTGGMPFTLPARVTMETDGLDVQIRYTVEGKAPTLKSECTIEGQTATGTLMPHDGGGNALVINLPLENGAEKVFDHSTGDGAKIVAQAGVKMTGQSKIRLILCEQSK